MTTHEASYLSWVGFQREPYKLVCCQWLRRQDESEESCLDSEETLGLDKIEEAKTKTTKRRRVTTKSKVQEDIPEEVQD